jgi:chitooligosaccharide deacetylase
MDRRDDRVKDIARELGMELVSFAVNPRDFTCPGVNVIAQSIITAPPGSIVLLHDGAPPGTKPEDSHRSQTVAAVDEALRQLKAK